MNKKDEIGDALYTRLRSTGCNLPGCTDVWLGKGLQRGDASSTFSFPDWWVIRLSQ